MRSRCSSLSSAAHSRSSWISLVRLLPWLAHLAFSGTFKKMLPLLVSGDTFQKMIPKFVCLSYLARHSCRSDAWHVVEVVAGGLGFLQKKYFMLASAVFLADVRRGLYDVNGDGQLEKLDANKAEKFRDFIAASYTVLHSLILGGSFN